VSTVSAGEPGAASHSPVTRLNVVPAAHVDVAESDCSGPVTYVKERARASLGRTVATAPNVLPRLLSIVLFQPLTAKSFTSKFSLNAYPARRPVKKNGCAKKLRSERV